MCKGTHFPRNSQSFSINSLSKEVIKDNCATKVRIFASSGKFAGLFMPEMGIKSTLLAKTVCVYCQKGAFMLR